MEFIKPGINLDFVGKRKLAFGLSVCMIVLTIFLVIWRGGPNLGVDFSGGVLVQVKMDRAVPLPQMRAALEVVQLQDSIIQEFGEEGQFEYLIRVRNVDIELTGLGDKVKEALSDEFGEGVEMRRVEMVGPKVGKDLRQKALFAIFYAILFIAIYISGRFELKWLMSIVMALSLALVVYGATSIGMSVTWLILMALAVTIALCWFLKLKY
ncbi:MAG: protein translocase subunit SecF, partial [Deltaproteobacteria bacterium]|nr:protein translocase subunit SecF [Deltaproteobacteria bacterium]